MSGVDEVARLADELGASEDVVRAALDSTGKTAGEALNDISKTGRPGGISGWAFTRTVDNLSRTPERVATSGIGAGKKTLLYGGGIAGGTVVGQEFLESQGKKYEAEAREDQSQALRNIMEDPHMSESEKKSLINRLMREGFFASSRKGDPSGPSLFARVMGNPFADMGIMQWVVFLIILYFLGRAFTEYAGSGGGN